ncbi:MAG TPA: S41 family peptidase [Acidobacteriota bacterium]|nr:S41 family peptidase [Acidobacteriota bacterium]
MNPERSGALKCAFVFAATITLAASMLISGHTQSLSGLRKIDISTGKEMIKILKKEVPKNYYDPAFHGVDLEAKFKAAEEKIGQVQSLGQVYGVVGQPLLDLNDMHTFFVPPPRPARIDYGWQMQIVGNRCFVVAVRPFSDAEKKGLRVGDEVLRVNGYPMNRTIMWKLSLINYVMRPGTTPHLMIQSPDGNQRELDTLPKVTQNQQVLMYETSSNGRIDTRNLINWVVDEARWRRHRFQDVGDDLTVWQCPHLDIDETTLNGLLGSVKKKKMLIVDLRYHIGGREEILEWFAGFFFDQDKKICDYKGRREHKSLTARSRGDNGFKGDLVVLVDSMTGGTGELFARLVQLEKRGRVIGDLTTGTTMKATLHRFDLGESPFAASISEADAVMPDGKSLERVGVTPDEILLPTAQDLAAFRDPVLAHAAELLGVKLDPLKAGALFPIEWFKDLLKE